MKVTIDFFEEIFDRGMTAIPVKWNAENKDASIFPKGRDHSIQDVSGLLSNGFADANGIAYVLHPPYGMFDFDLKHTNGVDVFNPWFKSLDEDIRSKVCVEQTRNGGYHIYIKYSKLQKKIALARNRSGEEVISVYTGGLLAYADPTPGYSIIHNDMGGLEDLTDAQFALMVDLAKKYNTDKEFISGEAVVKLVEYPKEYALTCSNFDSQCSDEVFEELINGIGLYPINEQQTVNGKKFGYVRYLRKDSEAKYSAKVYYRKIQIFSGSIKGYPCFQDRVSDDDDTWTLTPAKLVYYKNGKDWVKTMEEINALHPDPYFEVEDLFAGDKDDNNIDGCDIHPKFWEVAGKMDVPVNCPENPEPTYEWYLKLQAACPEFVSQVFRKMDLFTPVPPGVIPEGDYFSDAVYENLPPKLKAITDLIEGAREKDIALLGFIIPASAAYSRFRFIHGAGTSISEYSPHLMALVIGAAGCGKGNMRYGKEAVQKLSDSVKALSDEAFIQYQKDLMVYGLQKKDAKTPDALLRLGVPPIRPPKIRFEISLSDTTKASLFSELKDNETAGVFGFDTEIDTLVRGTGSRDFGGFGDIFRKAFHHEPIPKSIKGDSLESIKQARVSFLMSGTPQQLKKLISDEESGLFSRMWYYCVSDKFVPFMGMTGTKDVVMEGFKNLQHHIYQTAAYGTGQNVDVHFTDVMERELIEAMQDKEAVERVNGPSLSGSWFRIGIIVKRIAVTLAAFQGLEYGHVPDNCWRAAMAMLPAVKSHCIGAVNIVRLAGGGRVNISKESFDQMRAAKMTLEQIAAALGVSIITLKRRMKEW